MTSISEIVDFSMKLSVAERATLVSNLLQSLPSESKNDDCDVAEALRRDAEMDANPAMCLTFEEFKRAIGR